MAATDIQFAGSIPDLYDRFLVPLIFDPFAHDLATRVADLRPGMVLETAAGTGAVTRAMAARLAPEVRIVATDLSPAMLERAQARRDADKRTEWQHADALELPFADASFDVVVCQFGIMFFPDRVRGYAEARRVLKPGGTFLFNVWDRFEANAFPAAVRETMVRMFPVDPLPFLERGPYSHFDMERIKREVAQAGFVSVRTEAVDKVARASSAREAATALCHGSPLRADIEARGADRLAEATDLTEALLTERFGSGPIEGPIRAHVITAEI